MFFSSSGQKDWVILVRTYVSRKAPGKEQPLLEKLGLTQEEIRVCLVNNPLNVEEAVHSGLMKWGQGPYDNTWRVLIDAMCFAGVAEQHIEELMAELRQSGRGVQYYTKCLLQ